MMNYSISKRSIYPGMDLESQPDPGTERSQWSEYDRWGTRSRKGTTRRETDRSQAWNKAKGELQLLEELEEDIAEAYHSQQLNAVIAKGKGLMKRVKADLDREESQGELTEMEARVKNFMALSFIKRYRKNRDQKMLWNAKKLLRFQPPLQTPFRKARRLNNLGLCQLLLKRYANGFQYFSKAFELYRANSSLNILDLVRNIAELYVKWEMFEAAARLYQFTLLENDRERVFTLGEEAVVVTTVMRCINVEGEFSGRKAMFHRADKLLKRLGERKGQECLQMALRVELVRYAVLWGVVEGDFSRVELDRSVRDIESTQSEDGRINFLKGECLLAYRQLFRGVDWEMYAHISRCALKILDGLEE